jgi:hypothetical protein
MKFVCFISVCLFMSETLFAPIHICGELRWRCARRNVHYCRSILTKIGMYKEISVKYLRIKFHADYLRQHIQLTTKHAPSFMENLNFVL